MKASLKSIAITAHTKNNKWYRIILFLIISCFSLSLLGSEKESAIKVAYFYYFSKFVKWPSYSFSQFDSVNICVGDIPDDVRFQLSKIERKKVGERYVDIHHLENLSDVKMDLDTLEKSLPHEGEGYCHLLYVSPSMAAWYKMNRLIFPKTLLTISESSSALDTTIVLHQLGNKLRFYINNDNAIKHDLKISSKLLRLSRAGDRP